MQGQSNKSEAHIKVNIVKTCSAFKTYLIVIPSRVLYVFNRDE